MASVTNYGYCNLATANIARIGIGEASIITFPASSPTEAILVVFASAYTSSYSRWDGANDFTPTAKVESGGSAISVRLRIPNGSGAVASGFSNGSFYVYRTINHIII